MDIIVTCALNMLHEIRTADIVQLEVKPITTAVVILKVARKRWKPMGVEIFTKNEQFDAENVYLKKLL